jgi:diguanylate cyclase (GGDEF)-like protein/PAS domain S-box-containing protein
VTGSSTDTSKRPPPAAAAETHVRALLHGSRDLHVLVDQDGLLQWVSERVTEMLGYAVGDALGLHVLDLVHPEDVPGLVAGFRSVLREGQAAAGRASPLAARVRSRDGAWVRVEGMCSALVDDGDRFSGVLVNVRDVTWPRSAEDAVRSAAERFRALVLHSADAVVVCDLAGRVSYASPAFDRLFAWPPERLRDEGWGAFVLPVDHDAIREALGSLATRGPDEPYTGLFRVRHGDGGWRWVETVSANHMGNPAVGGIVTNVRDVSRRIEAEQALRTSEARWRTVVSGSFDVTAVIDGGGIVRWVTPNCERLLGCPPDAIVGRSGLDWVHPDDLSFMADSLTAFAAGEGVPNPAPIRMRHADGTWRDVEVVATDFLDNPDIGGIAINLRDIGERVAIEQERARLTEIFAMTSDHVSTYDLTGRLLYMNEAARAFLGVASDAPLGGVDVAAHLAPSARAMVTEEVIGAISARQTWTGELDVLDRHGAVVPMQAQLHGHRDSSGELLAVSAVLRDISERKSFEHRLRHEATHDPLTSLPNRTLILDRLATALARRRPCSGVALLFCDLDRFKDVNDSLGHTRGDHVLTEVARRLREQVRPDDTVGRFGGDEFVILLEDCRTVDDAVGIAGRVEEAMRHPFEVDGTAVHVGVSIGISLAVADGAIAPDPEALIRAADTAMYRAKERGRGRYQVSGVSDPSECTHAGSGPRPAARRDGA